MSSTTKGETVVATKDTEVEKKAKESTKKAGSASPPLKNPLMPVEPTKAILLPCVLVVTSSIASYYAGRFDLSVLYAVAASGLVVYSISTLRDKITQAAKLWGDRQGKRKACVSEEESVEWINATVYRFWQFYEPVLSSQIKESIDASLKDIKPPGLTGISVNRFTLGKTPPFISSARFLLKDQHSNDISESRIVLNLGLGLHAPDLEVVVAACTAAGSLPLCVKDVWFEGKLRIEIDLIPTFPHAQKVMVTFLEKPIIDFSIVPLKSVNIMEIPGLAQWLNSTIINGINDNLVNPEKLVINLMEQSGGKIQPCDGIIDCTIHSIEYEDKQSKNPLASLDKSPQEIYYKVVVGDKDEESHNRYPIQKKTKFYNFKEGRHILYTKDSGSDMVQVQVKSKNKVTQKTQLIGRIFMPVLDIVQSQANGNSLKNIKWDFEGDIPGAVNMSINFIKLDEVEGIDKEEREDQQSEQNEGGKQAPNQDTVVVTPSNIAPVPSGLSGSLLIHVHEAMDLQPVNGGSVDSVVRLYYTDHRLLKSRTCDKTTFPQYDVSEEFTCCDLSKAKLVLRIQEGHHGIGDLDLDLESLFHDEESNTYNYTMLGKWFKLRKPGPPEGRKDTTIDDIKGANNNNKKKENYGSIKLSIVFRPFELAGLDLSKETTSKSLFAIGNPEDDLSVTCYDNDGLLSGVGNLAGGVVQGVGNVAGGVVSGVGAVGSGVVSGVGTVGSGVVSGVGTVGSGVVNGVGTVGSGMVHGVGAVGSGMMHGVGAVGSGMGKMMRLTPQKSSKSISPNSSENFRDENLAAEAGNPIDLSSEGNVKPEGNKRRNSFGSIFQSKSSN